MTTPHPGRTHGHFRVQAVLEVTTANLSLGEVTLVDIDKYRIFYFGNFPAHPDI